MFSWRYWSAERKRRRLLAHCVEGPLHDYLSVPLVSPDARFIDTEFLVLDFETTGLDVTKDKALSLGYTVIRGGRIILAENAHFYFGVRESLPESSVVIHQITDQTVQEGERMEFILEKLLAQMRGRVLVAHFARIERSFIKRLVMAAYQSDIPMQIIDTLDIEYRRRQRLAPDVPASRLRLFNIRADYGLPRYKAHNALIDAISTAELLLLQASYVSRGLEFKLHQLM